MAVRGRPNKSNDQLVDNRKSRIKDPIIKNSTITQIPEPTIPLNEIGRDEYNRIYRNMIETGLYSELDFGLIQSACLYYQTHIKLEQSMPDVSDRVTITSTGTEILSSKSIESARCFDKYLKIIVQFGATPLARMRIIAKPKDVESEEDRFKSMFG